MHSNIITAIIQSTLRRNISFPREITSYLPLSAFHVTPSSGGGAPSPKTSREPMQFMRIRAFHDRHNSKSEIHRIFFKVPTALPGQSRGNCPDLHPRRGSRAARRDARGPGVRGAKKGRRELCRVINGAGHDFRGVQYAVRNLRGVVARAMADRTRDARDAGGFETATRRTGIEIVVQEARLRLLIWIRRQLVVFTVYREKERARGWQTITNRSGDKSPGITARALLARLAGYLTPHLLCPLCHPHEPRRSTSTSTCPIEWDEYANDVLASYPSHFRRQEVTAHHSIPFFILLHNVIIIL